MSATSSAIGSDFTAISRAGIGGSVRRIASARAGSTMTLSGEKVARAKIMTAKPIAMMMPG